MPDQFQKQCRFQKQRQKDFLPNQLGVFTCLRQSICLPILSQLWRTGGRIDFLILSIGFWLTTNLAQSANHETDNQTRRDIDCHVTAVRAEQPIKLDGVLDESA